MRLAPLLAPLLALALLVPACGGSDDTPLDPDAAPDVTPDAAVRGGPATASRAYIDALKITCHLAFRCRDSFPGDDATFQQEFGNTELACFQRFQSQEQPYIDQIQAEVDAGRIVYSSDDAKICLDVERDQTCDAWWNGTTMQPPECDTTFQGQVGSGGSCVIAEDCATNGESCYGDPAICQP